MAIVVAITGFAGVTIPAEVLTGIGIVLLILAGGVAFKFVLRNFKHAIIISAALVLGVMFIPWLPTS